jgi:hypothetical protein
MPMLAKQRWEQFAQSIVAGQSASQAYINAGFSKQGAAQAAHKLLKHPLIADRITELGRVKRQAEIIAAEGREKAVLREIVQPVVQRNITKEAIRARLWEIVERDMQHVPVRGRLGQPVFAEGPDGKLHALYKYNSKGATAALIALGKEEGMFIERKDIPKDEKPLTVEEADKEIEDYLAEIAAKQAIMKASKEPQE